MNRREWETVAVLSLGEGLAILSEAHPRIERKKGDLIYRTVIQARRIESDVEIFNWNDPSWTKA